MKMNGNTVLITGGGSGIGRGLAEAFHRLGNTVIIAGRRQTALEQTVAANPGMQFHPLDIGDTDSIAAFASALKQNFSRVNVLIHNAGIQRLEDLTAGAVFNAEETIATNLLGPIRLTAALLPMLMERRYAAILTVTSELAFVPQAMTPTYCATKAALHSYTQSLRFQLRDTSVEVIEIIPPWVQTSLQGDNGNNPVAMPLHDFIAETMLLLQTMPAAEEIIVERAKAARFAESRGDFDVAFSALNGTATKSDAD